MIWKTNNVIKHNELDELPQCNKTNVRQNFKRNGLFLLNSSTSDHIYWAFISYLLVEYRDVLYSMDKRKSLRQFNYKKHGQKRV